MHETRPTVSILIINYNTPQLINSLLESLIEHTRAVSYEVLILNNGCRPDGACKPESIEDGSVFIESSEKNLGFAAGANSLATKARGDFLLFANSDCVIVSDIVTEMTHYLQQHPRCGACSPRTIDPGGNSHSTIRRLPSHENIGRSRGATIKSGKGDYTLEAGKSRKNVEAMAATFMMVPARAFRQAGGFDEQFFMYVEDTDLCKRLGGYGYELAYLGDLEIRHRWGASTAQHPWRMQWHHHRSVWRYFRKHFPDRPVANFWLTVKLLVNFLIVSVSLPFSRGSVR